MENNSEQFEQWALLELMGHQRMAGKVTEMNIAGKGFLRIDVYERGPYQEEVTPGEFKMVIDHKLLFTRMVNPDSVYAINPIDEESALNFARHSSAAIKPYEVSKFLPPRTEEHKTQVEGSWGPEDDLGF